MARVKWSSGCSFQQIHARSPTDLTVGVGQLDTRKAGMSTDSWVRTISVALRMLTLPISSGYRAPKNVP